MTWHLSALRTVGNAGAKPHRNALQLAHCGTPPVTDHLLYHPLFALQRQRQLADAAWVCAKHSRLVGAKRNARSCQCQQYQFIKASPGK
jgi:hypothetical protein